MKRISLLLFLAWISLSLSAGQVTQTFYFSQPTIRQQMGMDLVQFSQTFLTNRAGEPLLPYKSISLLLPPGTKAESMEVTREGRTEITGFFNLFPAQTSKPLSEKKQSAFQRNEAIYKSSIPYPAESFGVLSTHYLNGFSVAFSSVTPLEYIPSEGKVFYYNKITVKIETVSDEDSQTALNLLKTTPEIIGTISRLVNNTEMVAAYPNKSKAAGDYELLIITTQSFAGSFEPLRSMYLTKGNRSQVVTTEYINANIAGSDLQMKIRNFIISAYQEHQIETVILGGDVELIPYRGFYCYVQSGSGYTDSGIPADLYYAALDGNWNNDGDSKWGEPGEDDLLPEIGIGRLPFSNAAELASLLNKSIKYQTQPVLGEFTKPLLAGEHLYSGPETWGSDYLELLIGNRSDNGYTTNGIPIDYTIQKMYDEEDEWSGAELRNAINAGKQYVHHVGHASQTYVAKMSNSDITNANFAQTNGVIHNFAIFHTHGCDCGSFDYNDCILERMVNIDNFAAAVIGNSRYGWFNEGQTEGPAAHLHREMNDAFFTDKISALGLAMTEAKIMTAPWVTAPGQWEEGALRWNFYDLNILGDPALNLWSAEPMQPQVSYSSELILGSTSTSATVALNGFPMPNAVCAVMYNGDLIARSKTNLNGVAELVFDAAVTEIGNAQLIVSGNNCLTQSLPITFIPASGPYVVYSHHSVDDGVGGNNNGLPDYNEVIRLEMAMKNVGLEPASNLVVTVTTDNPYITLGDHTFEIPQLPAGDTIAVINALELTIAHGIPNQQVVNFQMITSDGNNSWTSGFDIVVNAPQFQFGNFSINDAAGNNNGMPDAGENLQFIARISNTGSSTASMDLQLSSISPWITIENPIINIPNLQPGQLSEHSFNLHIDASTPYGTVISVSQSALDGDYSVTEQVLLSVGLRIEDFESGNFETYEWHHSGNADWTITMQSPFEGNFAAKSGAISDNQESVLWLSLIAMGNDQLSFARKVSSEAGYDYLRFFIDDSELDKWAGEIGWEEVSFPVNEGNHTLQWIYEKDVTIASGSDCAWIDKITFPGTTTMIDLGEHLSNINFSVWPNPNKGSFVIAGKNNSVLSLKIFNSQGQLTAQIEQLQQGEKLQTNLPAGIYVIEVSDGLKSFRTKMIVHSN